MTSRRHYVKKHNAILHAAGAGLSRGDNVPDDQLTPDQLAFRRQLQAMRSKIKYLDRCRLEREDKPLSHGPMCGCLYCVSG